MIRTKLTRTLALAGFAAVAAAILSVSASWTAFGQTPEAPAAQSEAKPAFSVLYTFTGGTDGSNIQGAFPAAGLILDRAGNLYGTTFNGGDLSCSYFDSPGCGVVYEVDQTGTETVLYTFTGAVDGGPPYAGVVRDPAGNLYGTTPGGGSFGFGTVFKLTPAGKESVLYSFSGFTDGNFPAAGVVRDAAGNLYGTTGFGGDLACPGGCGVVFKVDPTGKETVLHAFAGPPTDGYEPYGNLLRDQAGNLYGTTPQGGTSGKGVVFKLDPSGKKAILYNFTGGADGGARWILLEAGQAAAMHSRRWSRIVVRAERKRSWALVVRCAVAAALGPGSFRAHGTPEASFNDMEHVFVGMARRSPPQSCRVRLSSWSRPVPRQKLLRALAVL